MNLPKSYVDYCLNKKFYLNTSYAFHRKSSKKTGTIFLTNFTKKTTCGSSNKSKGAVNEVREKKCAGTPVFFALIASLEGAKSKTGF